MPDHKFHKAPTPQNLDDLAKIVDAQVNGDGRFLIHDVASLADATNKDISFLDNIKYKDDFKTTKAGACIVS